METTLMTIFPRGLVANVTCVLHRFMNDVEIVVQDCCMTFNAKENGGSEL